MDSFTGGIISIMKLFWLSMIFNILPLGGSLKCTHVTFVSPCSFQLLLDMGLIDQFIWRENDELPRKLLLVQLIKSTVLEFLQFY